VPQSDFLAKQRKQITTRLDELRPLYEEYLTLEKAQQALEQLREPIRRAVGRPRRGRPPARRGPGRPPTRRGPGRPRTRRAPAAPRAGRPRARAATRRAGATRADQALAAIRSNPGITIPELARKLRIRPNYLYRVTAELQRQRRIRRRGRGFHAT
jgi:hypothetical protein